MKNIDSMKELIYSNLGCKKNRLRLNTYNNDAMWLKKDSNRQLAMLYLIELTTFLPQNVSIRERWYYFINNLFSLQTCPFCCKERRKFSNKVLSPTCGKKECIKDNKARIAKLLWQDKCYRNKIELVLMKNVNKRKGKKISDIYNKSECDKLRRKLRESHLGIKQSEETKRKRINTRKMNEREWHSKNAKLNIGIGLKKSNKFKESCIKYSNNEEVKKKLSIIMKNKIQDGTFTPNITNTWTKWESFVTINSTKKKFRSNWEAIFWLLNQDLKYEKTRIKYSFKDTSHTYIVDFTDDKKNIIYEIKPLNLVNDEKNVAKHNFATEWCNKNNYSYVIIDELYFKKNISTIKTLLIDQPQLVNTLKQFS